MPTLPEPGEACCLCLTAWTTGLRTAERRSREENADMRGSGPPSLPFSLGPSSAGSGGGSVTGGVAKGQGQAGAAPKQRVQCLLGKAVFLLLNSITYRMKNYLTEAEALISSKAFTFRDTKENPSNRAAQWKQPPACRRGQDVPRGHLAPSLTAGARLAALSPGPKPVALGQLGVLPGPWFLHL